MIYKIRLKGRQKQGECSAILTMTFLIIMLSIFSLNLIPLVYASAVRPFLAGNGKENIAALAVSSAVLLSLWQVTVCLSFGCDRFMLKRAENHTAGAGDIFYYFMPGKLISLLGFNLRFSAYKFLMLTIVLLPFLLCGYGCYSLCTMGFSAAVCSIFALFTLIFFLLGIITYSDICDSLFLTRYRFIKGDYLNFKQLVSQSQSDMSERVSSLRRLKGSFAGWFLSSVLIVTIPYVWCYYRQTKACFAAEEY